MLFNSLSFLIFFPIVAIGYYLIPRRFRWVWLLLASCYFYMAFIPYYILILFYLIVIDFVMGILIEREKGRRRKLYLVISIIANVGTLFFFKYFNFFNANVAEIAGFIHWNYPLWTLDIALPLGLSFHTFQSLAYVIEVYKGRYPAERDLGIYALYVMFFPQLVAGPIERPQQLLPQLHANRPFDENGVSDGLRIMLWGFFKKVVVADTVGIFVDTVYGNFHGTNGVILALAAAAFALQLYGDFSGYSDIARGSAKVFGISLVNNFDVPFFSTSVAEFWRRWHISLSSWFRDYFYQPLAFKLARISRWGVYVALFMTFAVIGLWHGAAWTYILFGSIFGAYIIIGMLTKSFREKIARALGLARFPALRTVLQVVTTFSLVSLGLIFFRALSVSDGIYIVSHMFTGWQDVTSAALWRNVAWDLEQGPMGASVYLRPFFVPVSCLVMLFGEYAQREYRILEKFSSRPRWFRWSAYYALLLWIIVFGYYVQTTFIYFQF